jgi:hypothetical protein
VHLPSAWFSVAIAIFIGLSPNDVGLKPGELALQPESLEFFTRDRLERESERPPLGEFKNFVFDLI